MQYETRVIDAQRYARGTTVVTRVAQLLGQPISPTTLVRNNRAFVRREAWQIGAVLATAYGQDIDGAARRFIDGLRRGQLDLLNAPALRATNEAKIDAWTA